MKKCVPFLIILFALFVPVRFAYAEGGSLSLTEMTADSEVNPIKTDLSDPGKIISALLPYVLTAAGLVLFGMLIMGGFDMMLAGTDAKKAEAGKERITAAIIGFVIIFAAYWIVQILEVMFGISILK